MALTIADVESALVTALSGITGLRAWSYLPDGFTPPAIIVSVGEIDYHTVFGTGIATFDVPALLILSRSSDRASQAAMDGYRSSTGATSIRAALEADPTLGGVVAAVYVEKSTPVLAISINGAEYLASEFTLTVHA